MKWTTCSLTTRFYLQQMLILASQGLLSSIYWLNRYVSSLEMAMNSGQSNLTGA